ncbi:LacI family transcriptional regulator [Paenibacillus spiritus]|uniref:LacI family transcriptional regulator n=1 Tax=Paenibacillus spiritus TaxID=2496557 RepID=A0A5J5FZS4_9BACL|nr:LacI family DNA-binding transcriptional regulator [Paenibacillus spiritus]KAA8999759.1 LacI family transcriptional regulator [Paenibacillus spiritus]
MRRDELLITIYDIAKRTGLSPTTVSKVFNNYTDVSAKTRTRILEAAKEMGYLPNANARSLATKRSWTLGVLFTESSGLGLRHPFFGGVIENFKASAEAKGYDLMFISRDIGGNNGTYLEHCRFRGIDGVVVIYADPNQPEVAELLASDIPCVLLDFNRANVATICSDNVGGSEQAVRYLYELGHRTIAHLSGGRDTFAGRQRLLGYERMLEELGLSGREEWISDSGDFFSIQGGYEAMTRLLKQPELPTAVLAAGDNLAIGALRAIREHGLSVPGDISVVGFDDIESAELVTPPLTTVRQNMREIGGRAAQMLIGLIEGVAGAEAVVLPVELVIRESCRKV